MNTQGMNAYYCNALATNSFHMLRLLRSKQMSGPSTVAQNHALDLSQQICLSQNMQHIVHKHKTLQCYHITERRSENWQSWTVSEKCTSCTGYNQAYCASISKQSKTLIRIAKETRKCSCPNCICGQNDLSARSWKCGLSFHLHYNFFIRGFLLGLFPRLSNSNLSSQDRVLLDWRSLKELFHHLTFQQNMAYFVFVRIYQNFTASRSVLSWTKWLWAFLIVDLHCLKVF